jgi:ribosome-binding factor A
MCEPSAYRPSDSSHSDDRLEPTLPRKDHEAEEESIAAALARLLDKHISDPCLSTCSLPTTEVNVTVHGN